MQIKDLSIFHNLDDNEFKKSLVCTQSVIREYKKNDYIFFQGDIPNKLYLILNGEVELGSINVNGKVLRITNISEGEDFGEVELFLNKDCYSGYAKAKTDVKLLEIAKDFFGGRCEKNCSHHSKLVFNMLELFAKRADENNQQLEVLTSGNLKQRIATYLLKRADNNNLVSLSMNREELALYLNTTRPSLSNEQTSLKPLEQKILEDFECQKFIYCSDAGLGSESIREYNHMGERAYIVTQSIQSDIRNPLSLLAHNQITASQFIRRGLYPF